jgi:class 3 adenylate cyclase
MNKTERQGLLTSGIYYLVLVDIVGSTDYAVEHGDDAAAAMIESFVKAGFDAVSDIEPTSTVRLLDDLADAVILVFQHFPDILRWQAMLDARLDALAAGRDAIRIRVRTCVHVGDIVFHGVEPAGPAVSQIFEFEKEVGAGEICLTQSAYEMGRTTLARTRRGFAVKGEVRFEGDPGPTTLYRVRRDEIGSLVEPAQESAPPGD